MAADVEERAQLPVGVAGDERPECPPASVARYDPGSRNLVGPARVLPGTREDPQRARGAAAPRPCTTQTEACCLGHSRFASMIRCRNCCVRASRGRAEDLAGRPLLEDAAVVEEADLVGDVARERHLVGGDHHRHAARGELADHLEHLRDELGVERARHLVEEHQLRLHRERPHDRDALLLPAGEPIGVLRRACRRARTARAARSRARRPPLREPEHVRGASVTFRSTLMCGKRLNDWNTIPIRRRTAFTSRRRVISSPARKMRPASIGSSRLMQRSSVDLPDPDAPISATTSCSATVRSMPRRTSWRPKDLESLSTTSGVAHRLRPLLGGDGGRAGSASQ